MIEIEKHFTININLRYLNYVKNVIVKYNDEKVDI